jgi:glutaredoxin-like protein
LFVKIIKNIMEQIKVYGTKWCPDCVRAEHILNKHKVKFTWIDIDKDKQARAYVEKLNNGLQSVPTIIFPDGSILVEPSNKSLEKKLKEIGLI